MWKEIDNTYCEEIEESEQHLYGDAVKCICIDAWKTAYEDNCNEEGKVIAKVIKTKSDDVCVVYIDNCALYDEYVQEKIKEAVKQMKECKGEVK